MKPKALSAMAVSMILMSFNVGWHNLLDRSWLTSTALSAGGRLMRTVWR